jgi:branched-chain amino acid transport system ATP-binding protein
MSAMHSEAMTASHPQPKPTAEAALAAHGVVKRFGGITALNGASITVPRGHVVALVGPNGSGKTTFLSTLTGLQRPDAGRIELVGQDITRAAPNARARRAVAMTFQTPQLIDSLTVVENIEFACRLKRFPGGRTGLRKRIVDCLAGLTLSRVSDHPTRSLSGGQRKLVELARSLIVEPDVLLLDEPTAGVAPSLEPVIADHIQQAQARGVAVLLVSHNLPWTFALCGQVSVLAEGNVIAVGTADEIQQNAQVIDAYLH